MRILIASPFSSHPPTSGAKRRIFELTHFLQREGHEIHFFYTCHENVDNHSQARRMAESWDNVQVFVSRNDYEKSCGADYGIDDWVEPGLEAKMAQLCDDLKPDCVLINYIFLSKLFENVPDETLKVLDTHDKLSRRSTYEDIGEEPGFFHTTEEQEKIGLSRADVVLSIQDNEFDYFQKSGVPVVVVGHITQQNFTDRAYKKLEHVGCVAANNKFNKYSFDEFLPPLLTQFDALRYPPTIEMAGGICNVIDAEHPNLKMHGFVPDVSRFYGSIDLALNPTLAGTGLKIKTVEAMSYGVPLISTDLGFDGLSVESEFHNLKDVNELIFALTKIASEPFKTLTSLSNLSRSLFSEYQYNLQSNIRAVFSETLQVEKTAGRLADYIEETTSFLGSRAATDSRHKSLLDVPAAASDLSIAHVVNPVRMPKTSDLYIAQPITFESMRAAKESANNSNSISLCAVGFEEDVSYFPDDFEILPNLTRSALDVGRFKKKRKLPVLADILNSVHDNTEAEYVIFTNVDISVMPHFYEEVRRRISKGHDALVINRRTISKKHARVDEINCMYSDMGSKHPGFDCFVFPRAWIKDFKLEDVVLGAHFIGRALIWNLVAMAKNLTIIQDEHLTFHLGDDNSSKDLQQLDYVDHNTYNALQAAHALERDFDLGNKLKQFDEHKLRSVNFGPQQFVNASIGVKKPDRFKAPIFLHSLFRAGSTWIWAKLRKDRRLHCYYEPLHEDLSLLSTQSIDWLKSRHKPDNFHKLNVDEWFFWEYEHLIGDQPPIDSFKRSFSYFEFFKNGPNPRLRAYVDKLRSSVKDKRTLLQFNRTSSRQEWFKREYPSAWHIYLLREARNQWMSYCSFKNGRGVLGFLRNNLIALSSGIDDPTVAKLRAYLPLVSFEQVTNGHVPTKFNLIFDDIFHKYSLEEMYLLFYFSWLHGVLQACKYSDLICNLERIETDAIYRMEVEFEFARHDCGLDFDDIRNQKYPSDEQNLPETTFRELETIVEGIFSDWMDEKVHLRLKDCGLGDLSKRMETAAPVTPTYGRDAIEEREANLITHSSGTATVTESRSKSATRKEASLSNPETANPETAIAETETVVATKERTSPALSVTKGKVWQLGAPSAMGLLKTGWSYQEDTHVWSVEPQATIALTLDESASQVQVEFLLRAEADSNLTIKVNDITAETLNVTPDWTTVVVDLNAEQSADSEFCITFCVDNLVQEPFGERTLGIAVATMNIEPVTV